MESYTATPTRPPHPSPAIASSSPSPSSLRLWRPAAQRNLRNQWSRLVKAKEQWLAAADEGHTHATMLVNTHLSLSFMPGTDLGALKDMPGIRHKASAKLLRREEQYRNMLLSAYKDMVHALSNLVNASRWDGGGVPVFKWLSILEFESLAQELADMFVLELKLKRLLLLELLWIPLKDGGEYQASLDWEDELYDGESNKLQSIGLHSGETCRLPEHWHEDILGTPRRGDVPPHEVLKVYLAGWRANVNIKKSRIDEIFELAVSGEEMPVKLS